MSTIGPSLTEGFFMFWETLWALVLGFTLSGAVQSFVSRAEMQRVLGDHSAKTIVRTSLLGAASSSCSYAASALAKSLFQRGADFTASMVFMFASTNLVVEVGIVLWLLIGWQFALAEFVGGTIMIILYALLAPRIFPAAELAAARDRLNGANAPMAGHDHGSHDHDADHNAPTDTPTSSLRTRLRSKAGWADAAGYTVSDLTMLRRELLIGYLVAGFLAVAVPTAAYRAVFITGHGFWTALENAVVGPFIAFISFVCSIGNVPLAAALYKGGISFGGTVAFVFADLIAFPLVVIYGKFYGRRLAVRLFFSFWLVMSTAGLLVDLLFRAVHISFPAHPLQVAPTRFAWNYTTFLNIVFLLVAGLVYWIYRHRDRFGGGQDYGKDPVCGMQVERRLAPATAEYAGVGYVFCSPKCHDRFVASPARFLDAATEQPAVDSGGGEQEYGTDPVCGMQVERRFAAATALHAGVSYVFCSLSCHERFIAAAAEFLDVAAEQPAAPDGCHS